jgi:hypothetical protein
VSNGRFAPSRTASEPAGISGASGGRFAGAFWSDPVLKVQVCALLPGRRALPRDSGRWAHLSGQRCLTMGSAVISRFSGSLRGTGPRNQAS